MRIIEPSQFKKPLKKKRRTSWLVVFVLIVFLAGFVAVAFAKPLPAVVAQQIPLSAAMDEAPTLSWPNSGQAAIGAVGYGVLGESGAQSISPTASVAKIMTAYAVLQKKPLKIGEQGPTLTLDQTDIDAYNRYVAQDGSVVAVNYGEQISEYQALQAMLLPSANNIAYSLSRWAFGSEDAYVQQANQLAQSLHMTQTKIKDASGFAPGTTSTPHDLVLLAEAAMQQPVIASVVAQTSAVIPVVGEIRNTNWLLSQNGINGIKTGNTTEAGGCFLFSSTQTYPNGQKITLIGAVMGATDLNKAMRDSATLLRSAVPGFREVTLVKKDAPAGTYSTQWGSKAVAIASDEVKMLVWTAKLPIARVSLNEINAPMPKGAVVGNIVIKNFGSEKNVPLKLNAALSPPALSWRASHIINK